MQNVCFVKSRYWVSSFKFINFIEFFDHDNIIELIDVQKPSSATNYDDVYIITQLMEADLH